MTIQKVKEQRPAGFGHTASIPPNETEDERLIRRNGQTDLQNDEEDKAVAARGNGTDIHTSTRETHMPGDLAEDDPTAKAVKRDNETQNTLVPAQAAAGQGEEIDENPNREVFSPRYPNPKNEDEKRVNEEDQRKFEQNKKSRAASAR